MFDTKAFQREEQKKKLIFRYMCKNSIPANADNKVVAGENAKSVYVVTVVEQETTDIEGVYDNFDSAKSHFANLKEWIREFWEDDYEESPEDIRINYDSDTYYEVYNECQCVKIILEIVEKKVENSYNPIIKDMTQLTVRPDAETGVTTALANTANEMKELVKSFNEKMRKQVSDEFDTAVITLNDIVEQEGEENKCVDFFSVDFVFGYDYEAKWMEFVCKQAKVEASVAIEFYRKNADMFIDNDAMEEYVRSLADEYGVDDISSFYKQACKIYKDNPYYDDNVDIVGDSEEEIVKTAKEKRLIDFLMGIESRPSDVEDRTFYIEDEEDAADIMYNRNVILALAKEAGLLSTDEEEDECAA
jgi:hypothetical protein